MIFFRKLFQFYIHSNIHVSIAVWSMAMITGLYFGIDTKLSSIFLALSTLVSYNVIRFLKYKTGLLNNDMNSWFSHHFKLLLVLNLIAFFKVIQFVFALSLVELLTLLPFTTVTVFYMLPIIRFNGSSYSLRKIPGVKLFCIAASWAGLVAVFPLVTNVVSLSVEMLLFLVQQFLFVIVLTLPFDIRDMNSDSRQLKTIPIVLGLRRTKILTMVLLVVINVISIRVFNLKEVLVLFFISFLLGMLVLSSGRKQSKYYASFWVEGIPIFWFLTLYLYGP